MEQLIIGFSRSKKRFPVYGWLIMLFEGTPFSHVYIRWYSQGLDRNIIYQASGQAVNFMNPATWTEHNKVVEEFQIPVSEDQKKKIVQFAMDNVGIPYGWKAAIGMGYMKIMSWFGKKVKNPFRDGRSAYVCSELVATMLTDYFGANIKDDLDSAGPAIVYDYIKRIQT